LKKGYSPEIDKLLNAVNPAFENNTGDVNEQYKKMYSDLDNIFKNNITLTPIEVDKFYEDGLIIN
jgi:hypothetical protein